ncbi:DNA-binding response regulator [Paenibacillaceae bacterium]|nr:DNA-binding response regulator [Paenibacillaceae bacterium]
MGYSLLIVEDEPDIAGLLKKYFEKNGYRVMTASNGLAAIGQAENKPDIILLDINMPELDGYEVCRRIRSFVACPILFLTARVDDVDKINGFAAGGDDYIIKPFSIDELGARVAAHLRREERQLTRSQVKFSDDLVIDYSAKEVCCRGAVVPLTKHEFKIIAFLTMHSGQVFDKERIYEQIWGLEGDGSDSVVVEHVRKLRAKLSAAGAKSHIETIWGLGYKWVQ